MPRHRLALRAYVTFHGQMLVGPYADPKQVEHEAWALLRGNARDQGLNPDWVSG